MEVSHTIINLIIFVLAIYVGYHVVWTVTPALHTPLMAVTNAISAIVIVGAMLAAALTETGLGKTMGVLAVALADVVISTALIPGRPAPKLVSAEMVQSMKPGSVVVDLAAANGGNCALTVPGQIVQAHGVTIVGETNLPALVAADASALYARNVLDFLKLVLPKDATAVNVPLDDDIVAACLMTRDGQLHRKG